MRYQGQSEQKLEFCRELPLDHGYPIRIVAPGITGARCVKWVRRVVASQEECNSHWQQKDYKSFNPSVDWNTVDWTSAPAIQVDTYVPYTDLDRGMTSLREQETPITAAITDPSPEDTLFAGQKEVIVRGYAWAGGGKGVIRVDITADGGQNWTSADLQHVKQHWNR